MLGLDTDEYKIISTGKELVKFTKKSGIAFRMSKKEADLLIRYMGMQGYVVGQKDGQFFRGELHTEVDRIEWEEATVEDFVDSAMEWNYELLQKATQDMENPDDFMVFANKYSRYEDLRADEKVLDVMFDRTKYGEWIEQAAHGIAGQFIQSLLSEGDMDTTVKLLVQSVKTSELPNKK